MAMDCFLCKSECVECDTTCSTCFLQLHVSAGEHTHVQADCSFMSLMVRDVCSAKATDQQAQKTCGMHDYSTAIIFAPAACMAHALYSDQASL